eukprot:COSAG04_NODE_19445_length_416_cov_0.813880_1_plen_48_part_01
MGCGAWGLTVARCRRSYCDREFDGEKVLVQHQTAKHFTCLAKNCGKRC